MRSVHERVREARKRGNVQELEHVLNQWLPLVHDNPDSIHELAEAEGKLGHIARAMELLGRYASMGMQDDQWQRNAAFAALRKSGARLERQFRKNRLPVHRSSDFVTLPDNQLVPEDIVFDKERNCFLLTSIYRRHVYEFRCGADNGLRRLELEERDATWPTLALALDSERKILWVTREAVPGYEGISHQDAGTSAVYRYDLRSGKLVDVYYVPPKGDLGSELGDLSLSPNGDLFVSDGYTGKLYRARPGEHRLELISDRLFSTQQSAIAEDGKHLFVADYLRGLAVIDLETKRTTWVSKPPNVTDHGVDGLYYHKHWLIAIQNAFNPVRILAFKIDRSFRRVKSVRVIDVNTEGLGVPTHGVIVGSKFFYMVNGSSDHLNEAGRFAADFIPAEPKLRAVDLRKVLR